MFVLVETFIVNDMLILGSPQYTLQKITLSLLGSFTLGQASRAALLVLLRVMQSVLSAIRCVALACSCPSY